MIIKSLAHPKTDDIRQALFAEGKHSHFHKTGHEVPQQGSEYVELRNVTFECDKNFIIDAPEYENLSSLLWYAQNYEPLIMHQVPNVINKLVADIDTRQAILQFYDADENTGNDMICTMYVSLRLDKTDGSPYILTYTVHMRSSDVREFRSDLRWHKQVANSIIKELSHKFGQDVWLKPIVWYADSLQCWDKDWEFLKKKEE